MGKKILVSDDGFSELLEGLCGIKAIVPKNSFGNIFTLPSDFKKTRLNEAYYATYPIEKVVGYLKKRYGKTAISKAVISFFCTRQSVCFDLRYSLRHHLQGRIQGPQPHGAGRLFREE